MPAKLTGGCSCGGVTYTITVPDEPGDFMGHPGVKSPYVDFDHCADCRKASGSIFQTWIMVPAGWLEVFSHNNDNTGDANSNTDSDVPPSKPSTTLKEYRSSPHIARSFCGVCGTHLFYRNMNRVGTERDKIDITLGSLDEVILQEGSDLIIPGDHSWWNSGIPWVKKMIKEGQIGGLPKLPRGDPRVKLQE